MTETVEAVERVWILVCKGDACNQKGNPEKVRVALKQAVRDLPAKRVKVSYVSCLGMCGEGPNVLVCSGGKLFKHCTGRESAEIVGEARGLLGRTDP